MFHQKLKHGLLAGTAAGVLFAGPALAQQEQCAQRLDEIEQQVAQAQLDQTRQSEINDVIEGARLLAESDDQEGCMNVVAELDDLMATLEESGQLQASQGGQQDQQAQAGDQHGDTQQQAQGGAQQQDQGATSQQAQTAGQEQGQSAQQQEQTEVTARVTIDQPQPQVLVKQKPPKITVRIPKPIITVRLPQPEVQVQMPDPEVQVEQVDPDIQVVMGQPDLQVQGTQAEREEGQQQVPADVQFERDQQQQAEVEVQTEEPEVRVEQEDANVQVSQSDRPQDQQSRQQMTDASQQGGKEDQASEETQQAMGRDQGDRTSQSGDEVGEADMESLQPGDSADQQQAAAGDEQEAQAGDGQQAMSQEDTAESRDQQMAATDQEPVQDNPLAVMPASDVIGSEVRNAEGDTVAEIVDLVKRQGQDDLYAVLSVGGFLGIGDKEVVVSLDELDVGQNGEIVMANASEEQLTQMPEYEAEGYEKVSQLSQ
jgi:hypothetical protein